MRRTWKTWMRLRRLVRPEVTVAMGSRRIRIDLRDRIIAKRLYLGIAWEVFPQGLRAAGSSAQEVMELLRDGDQVDVIVCRNAALLEEVLGRWHGGRLGP